MISLDISALYEGGSRKKGPCGNQIGASRKNSKATVFKTKQFSLYVVVPEGQWNDMDKFQEKLKTAELARVLPSAIISKTPAAGSGLGGKARVIVSASTDILFTTPLSFNFEHLADDPPMSMTPTATSNVKGKARVIALASTSTTSLLDKSTLPDSTQGPDPTKHHHHQASSISSTTTQSPPHKKHTPATIPDRDHLKKALLSGGTTNIDVQTVVDFYLIPTCNLAELVAGKAAFDIENTDVHSGTIQLSSSRNNLLGAGAFKTAQLGQLNLSPLRAHGLGSQPNEAIALKQPYTPLTKPGFIKLFHEANVLYWAKALLNMTYNYIHHCIAEAPEPPLSDIPQIRFVNAALVLAYAEKAEGLEQPGAPKLVPSSVTIGYLTEELIRLDDDSNFTKFVHNLDPSPFILPGEYRYQTAEFLVFTQHIQYINTGGQVYISDYQGSTTLLSDPQILTHPDVNKGQKLFSEGNYAKGVAAFEKEHICNKYCKWPGFQLDAFGGGESSGTA
ncbi:hypothetical protein BS17DRAFT_805791 [Gyrodon lividus]|nr:hypothetical protein BS17DRAFT_805791 [Gyrodon lividus]